jgi:hypothetical protein
MTTTTINVLEKTMTTPTKRSAYLPYYEVLDRALDSTTGLRIECNEMGEAYQYRVRLNRARTLDQNLNRMSRPPDDPKYGISDYDNLIFQIREEDGKWWVYVRHNRIDNHIEEIPA